MEGEYTNLNEISEKIISAGDNSTFLIFANNSTGKTTISRYLSSKKEPEECLCFNTFMEESFTWMNDLENDEFYIEVNNSIIDDAIITQGLDGEIKEKFKELVGSKIEPNFVIENNRISKITFSLATGDDAENNRESIKISKGEESIFVWSIFSILAKMVIEEKDNENSDYANLNYIVIDDPITSLGEEKITAVAYDISNSILRMVSSLRKNGKEVGILIMTHNRSLFNILASRENKAKKYRISKNSSSFIVEEQDSSPFGYHIEEIKIIKGIIDNGGAIEKIHFNMFRNILEKTASFLGYGGGNWKEYLSDNLDKKGIVVQLLQSYSHSRISELDDKKIYNSDDIELFKTFFKQFIKDYKWDIDNILRQ